MNSPQSATSLSVNSTERRLSWLPRVTTGIFSDVRQVLRQLRRAKGFATATLVTLALCIGTTTAIFSMVYSLLLKPLPFDEAPRLVELYDSAKKAGLNKMPSNVVQYLDYQKNATSYETLGLWSPEEGMFGEEGSVERLAGVRITADFFTVLRVHPLMGQFFTKEQNRPGADNVVVLTQSFWEKQFAEDPGTIGKTIRIDGQNLKIIGIAPRIFEAFDARVKYIQPFSWPAGAEDPQGRYALYIYLYGRLKPGATIEQAKSEATAIEKRYYDSAPPPTRQFIERSGVTVEVDGYKAQRVEPVRSTLYLLQGGVLFVLLIGCVNVANLLLVRSNARQSELAIRFALGAGRGVIARLLLVESLVLTGLGALLGFGLAWGALRVINRYTAEMLPNALPMALDGRVLAFGFGLAVIVGVAIGLIPAFHLLRTNLSELIQRSSRGASAGRGMRRLSGILVVVQMAVALMLLAGAGLLIHSFANALNVDPGLDPRHVLLGRIALPAAYRDSDVAAKGIQDRLVQAMGEIPGVTSVALSFSTPFKGGVGINALTLPDDPLPPGAPQPGAFRVVVTRDYLATMRLRLVEGRFFEATDLAPGRKYFVVDETFARRFFPKGSAIGGRFSFSGRPEKEADWPTVIGVVHDVPHNGVEEHSGNPFVYELLQGRAGGLTIFVRTERATADVIGEMREKIHGLDRAIPLFDTGTLQAEVDSSFDSRRAVTLLLAAFAGLALFLSTLGIYSVLAYDVSERTREIGVRGAIGASRGQIVAMILRQGLWKAGIGLALGLIGAGLLSRYMTSLLFQVKQADPIVYVAVSAVLLVVAALASYVPARRAARIDPMVALRCE